MIRETRTPMTPKLTYQSAIKTVGIDPTTLVLISADFRYKFITSTVIRVCSKGRTAAGLGKDVPSKKPFISAY